jgi:hypothetical protein
MEMMERIETGMGTGMGMEIEMRMTKTGMEAA